MARLQIVRYPNARATEDTTTLWPPERTIHSSPKPPPVRALCPRVEAFGGGLTPRTPRICGLWPPQVTSYMSRTARHIRQSHHASLQEHL